MDKAICKGCPDRELACHDRCARFRAWRAEHEAEKQYTYSMTHTMDCYHRDYKDKHRETGAKRYFGHCGGDPHG